MAMARYLKLIKVAVLMFVSHCKGTSFSETDVCYNTVTQLACHNDEVLVMEDAMLRHVTSQCPLTSADATCEERALLFEYQQLCHGRPACTIHLSSLQLGCSTANMFLHLRYICVHPSFMTEMCVWGDGPKVLSEDWGLILCPGFPKPYTPGKACSLQVRPARDNKTQIYFKISDLNMKECPTGGTCCPDWFHLSVEQGPDFGQRCSLTATEFPIAGTAFNVSFSSSAGQSKRGNFYLQYKFLPFDGYPEPPRSISTSTPEVPTTTSSTTTKSTSVSTASPSTSTKTSTTSPSTSTKTTSKTTTETTTKTTTSSSTSTSTTTSTTTSTSTSTESTSTATISSSTYPTSTVNGTENGKDNEPATTFSSTSSTTATTSATDVFLVKNSKGLIIGLVLGLGLGLIAVLVLSICLAARLRRKSGKGGHECRTPVAVSAEELARMPPLQRSKMEVDLQQHHSQGHKSKKPPAWYYTKNKRPVNEHPELQAHGDLIMQTLNPVTQDYGNHIAFSDLRDVSYLELHNTGDYKHDHAGKSSRYSKASKSSKSSVSKSKKSSRKEDRGFENPISNRSLPKPMTKYSDFVPPVKEVEDEGVYEIIDDAHTEHGDGIAYLSDIISNKSHLGHSTFVAS